MLKRHLPAALADRVRALHLLNVYFEAEPQRLHPGGRARQPDCWASSGATSRGCRAGDEWNGAWPASPAPLQAEVDTAGDEIALGLRDYQAPVRGADVVTTIDRYAQRLVERELDAAMKRH